MADYCFRGFDSVGFYEPLPGDPEFYPTVEDVPLQTWRSESHLCIPVGPQWRKLKENLLMDTCRVEALRIEGNWEMGDGQGCWLFSTLADPACSLKFLRYELGSESPDMVVLSKFLITSLETSRLRYLDIRSEGFQGLSEENCKRIAEVLGNGACPLLGLRLDFRRVIDARHLCTPLQQPECNLRRLGLMFHTNGLKTDWEWVDELLRNPACKLLELSIDVRRGFSSPDLQDLQCGLERLRIVCPRAQLPKFTHKLKEVHAEVLGSPRDLAIALERPDCKLEIIVGIFEQSDESGMQRFFEALLRKECTLRRLTVYLLSAYDGPFMIHIFRALRSKDCKLESLRFPNIYFPNQQISMSSAKILVEALEGNFRLCTLAASLPSSVQARVSNLLRRNQLLKEGGLLQQPQIKPRSARLFLCGHERVGKTTIRKQIFHLVKTKGMKPLHKVKREPPTRGMELQSLTFGKKKLVFCDLAGHKEYHAFHHYFLTGSDRDLFLVVCKANDRPDQREFSFKLRYWLRFIASHRTPGKPSPKVIVVLNFFSSTLNGDVMTNIASESTRTLMQEYADVLDFGQQRAVSNAFGINALDLRHFSPIVHRLKDLLTELLDSRSLIPKICNDISSIIAPSTMSMFWKSKPLFYTLSHIVSKYCKKLYKNNTETDVGAGAPFRAALVELHNAGQVVFFPSNDDQDVHQIVIVDCQWFCCNLIGILMQPEEIVDFGQKNLSELGVWLREDIAKILLQQNCQREHIPNVLQYLHRLELFYSYQADELDTTLLPSKLMFPSLLPETHRSLQWQECEDKLAIFGRRLECEDKVKTLLPAGAFARLQVRLHSEFGNKSWKVGCGWIKFVENCVATIVRFGGETSRWEDRQWIDIMVRYPEPREKHENTAENIVLRVKEHIFTICQGLDRGVPAVSLQECVMSEGLVRALEHLSTDTMLLDTVKEEVRKKGVRYNLTWSDDRSTPILDLFLPGELRELVCQDLYLLREIAQEFHITDCDDADSPPLSCDEESCETSLSVDNRLLWQLLNARLDRQDNMLKDIFEGVSHIRSGLELLLQILQYEEVNIFTSCSYQLVKDLLTGPLPAFPFLTDRKGLWQPIKNLVGKEVDLHFLCEWYEGAHEVEYQKGLPVKISRPEWLVRAGPVLVPALKVACCAARLAASVVLPGSQVFVPSSGSLSGFGFSGEQFQQQVLPEIIKRFVDEVPDLQGLTSRQPPVDKSRLGDFLFDLLKGENVDMERDFQLFRVEMPQNKRIAWVCRDHSEGLKRLKNQDPFQ